MFVRAPQLLTVKTGSGFRMLSPKWNINVTSSPQGSEICTEKEVWRARGGGSSHSRKQCLGGGHNKAGGHTISQSWQHAQDLHKLMPDKSPSWKTEREHEAEGYCHLIADRKGKISSFICTSGSTPRSSGPTQIWLHGLMCVMHVAPYTQGGQELCR